MLYKMNSEIIENVKKNLAKGLQLIDEIAIKNNIEIWRSIDGYPNYEVSSFGNVRNVVTGTILKPRLMKGYSCVNLCENGKRKHCTIHRLVAKAFIQNPNNKLCVDHKNNVKADNNVKNLRWATIQENGYNATLSNRNTSGFKGVRFNKSVQKWTAYIQINGKNKHIGSYTTLQDAKEARQLKAKNIYGEFQNDCEK